MQVLCEPHPLRGGGTVPFCISIYRCQVGVGLYIRYGYVSSKAKALKSALARALCGLKTEEADRVPART